MSAPGRPPVGPVVKVRMDPDMLKAVDRFAKAAGLSRAEMIRDLIASAIVEWD